MVPTYERWSRDRFWVDLATMEDKDGINWRATKQSKLGMFLSGKLIWKMVSIKDSFLIFGNLDVSAPFTHAIIRKNEKEEIPIHMYWSS